jgi:hypothetical protein
VESGEVRRLRGLNRSGLEYAAPVDGSFLAGAAVTERELDEMILGWGANVVRIPFSQDRILRGSGSTPSDRYLADLDRLVEWTAARRAYVILTLLWRDSTTDFGRNRDGTVNRVPALPDRGALDAWRRLAHRYRQEPGVLFEVFNEPHDPIVVPADPACSDVQPCLGIRPDGSVFELVDRRVTGSVWRSWARALVDTIRAEHPRSVVLVPGIDWAYDLRGMPLAVEEGSAVLFRNLVYTTHVYPWRGSPGGGRRGLERGIGWMAAFGHLARLAPVLVSEWGGGDADVVWGRTLAAFMDEQGLGWTAWSWSDRPRLVRNAALGDYEPTAFGGLVRSLLTARPRGTTD